jgi:hypothetical protein
VRPCVSGGSEMWYVSGVNVFSSSPNPGPMGGECTMPSRDLDQGGGWDAISPGHYMDPIGTKVYPLAGSEVVN